jgi:hypothetical protein
MRKRIHVDQHTIRANGKEGAMVKNPPLSVKTYKKNVKAYSVEIHGPSRLVYSPDKPLSCGAKVWLETDAPVTADGRLIT